MKTKTRKLTEWERGQIDRALDMLIASGARLIMPAELRKLSDLLASATAIRISVEVAE